MKPVIDLKPIIFSVLLALLILNLALQIYSNWGLYTTPFNPESLGKIYKYSQFAPNPEDRRLIIEDNDLFAYSGYLYLKGIPPSKIQIEHPPLTKYLFGLSILLFKNPNVIQVFFGGGLLLVIYQIGMAIFQKRLLAIIPPLLLSFDQTFKQQFALSYLDLAHVFFVSCAIFFYLKAATDKKYYLLSSVFLGATISSKYLGLVIIPLLFIHAFLKRRDDFRFFICTLLLVPAIYLANYLTLGFDKNFFAKFSDLHLAVIKLDRSYLPEYPRGEIWRLLVTGQWRVWFGPSQFVKAREWSILWPITLIGLAGAILAIRKTKNEALIITTSFGLLYLVTSSFHVLFPRYLLIFLPFGYISLTFVANMIFEKLIKNS